jgi:hypothetical protein
MSNKNHGFVSQIASKESRTCFYAMMTKELDEQKTPSIVIGKAPQFSIYFADV